MVGEGIIGKDDPYGDAIAVMRQALDEAMQLSGSMSEDEYENLKKFEEYIRRLDNA